MDNLTIFLIIMGVVFGAGVCFFILFPFLKRKGVNTEELLGTLSKDMKGINSFTDALKTMFPDIQAIKIIDKVVDYAEIGVAKAEQLYKINQIQGDERKAEAEKFVFNSLSMAGIEITDQVRAIVDGCIEAAVLGLGHAPKEIK